MRPRRLVVRGFACFRDEVAIDFTPLDLLAITGPTGAGKTSILDAITLALYGRVYRVEVGYLTKGRTRNAPTRACRDAPMPMLVGSNMEFTIDAVLVASRDVQTLTQNDASKVPGHT